MKIMSFLAFVLLVSSVVPSCKKKDEASAEDVAKANEFKAYIITKRFQVDDYYSDKAIDYVTTDTEVKSETDLWPYVSSWIQDDFNVFNVSTGKVTVTQNTHKLDGLTEEVFTRDFSIGADSKGPYFAFLDYQYNPLTYRLVSFTDTYFLVYVDWTGGAKVYTKFAVLPD